MSSSSSSRLLSNIPNAAEACRTISSKADEIKAHYSGAANVVSSIQGFFNPRNYKTENEVSTQLRNNFNIDLSTDDVKKIRNSCENVTSTVQSNVIDNSRCEYCQKNRCTISGITQTNTAQNSQECSINSLIDTLMNKSATVDTMAVVKAIQDAKGIASSNTAKTSMCTNVNQDLSTTNYFENISSCANKTLSNQSNELIGCGDLINNIQSNSIEAFNKCMNNATSTASTSVTSEYRSSASVDTGQKADNSINPWVIFGSLGMCCVVLIILGVAAYLYMQFQTS